MIRRRHPWFDAGWPVFAGLVAATGVLAAYQSLGLVAVVVAFVLVELSVAPTAWSIVTEMGKPGRPAIFEIAPAFGLGVVSLMGLVEAIGVWSLLVVTLLLLTSPLVSRQGRERVRERYGSDRSQTRRSFDEIVAHGWTMPAPEDDPER
jgi:hypothetical protein